MKSSRLVGRCCLLVLCALAGSFCSAAAPGDADSAIVDLYKSGKLFDKAQYRAVRAAFAQRFEALHQEVIEKAFGDDRDKLTAWLQAHPDVKEDLYTALDEEHDNLDTALVLFKEIWKAFPDQAEAYASAAIAVAVTWDDDKHGVYDYTGHEIRTKSIMPGNQVDALGNFRYLVEEESVLEGRARHLPWEFLTFVVNHRTPVSERKWAQKYFQSARGGRVKSWHQDVPYDEDMLKGEMTKNPKLEPKLASQDYTLANIKSRGGVCAQQADFACRVGKSVCVPAAFCSGESAYRGLHAWTLLVQVEQATKDKVTFSLISDGRFVGFVKDAFYTGTVIDPQTCQKMLDRDMEQRLWVVGTDRVGKRQADLLMRAYPWLCRQLDLDLKARVSYLDRCLTVSPYNETAWKAFARMAKDGELKAAHKEAVLARLTSLSKTFANYPDFIWEVFDDILTVQPDPQERVRQYEIAVGVFERHKRPDLVCDARLKIAEQLGKQEKWPAAAQGLVTAVRKFPTEGRYVPKMTQQLREVSKHYKAGNDTLAKLYLDLVPAMVLHYEGDTNEYYTKMYDQAMEFFRENKLDKYAAELKQKTDQARQLAPK